MDRSHRCLRHRPDGNGHGGKVTREIENQLYRYLTAEQGEGSWEFVPFLGLPY